MSEQAYSFALSPQEKTWIMELENYVKQHLESTLLKIIETESILEVPHLSIYEKAIIFAYTDAKNQQHQRLNAQLRESQGTEISDFGHYLEASLEKLTPYKGLVYRGVEESYCDIERYVKAMNNRTVLTEYSFLSTTQVQTKAIGFGNVLFRIYSRSGKNIEKISKFGTEKEVLFSRNTQFKVVNVTHNGQFAAITLKEIKK